jgi:monoamine oxidase
MNGFIDGAVRSGERAADEILAAEAGGRAAMTA